MKRRLKDFYHPFYSSSFLSWAPMKRRLKVGMWRDTYELINASSDEKEIENMYPAILYSPRSSLLR